MADYTVAEVNQLTQILKDLATLKVAHPGGPNYNIDPAMEQLTEARDFYIEVIKRQEKEAVDDTTT